MTEGIVYRFQKLLWSIYFTLTICMIGFAFGYTLTFAVYFLAACFGFWPRFHLQLRRSGDLIACLSIRILLKMQPWLRCTTNLPTIIGFYSKFKTRNIVFVGNHRSNLDTFLLISYIPGLSGLAKKSLFYNIFFSPFMYAMGFIPVDKAKPESFIEGLELLSSKKLSQNKAILVFPETTRCQKGFSSVNKFSASFFGLAIDSKSLIIPLCLKGTDKIMGRGDFLLNPYHPVEISMLNPIKASDFSCQMKLRDFVWGQLKAELT